jgi:phospholipase C
VNAIGESKYWDSTVIFVFWDDYGGWYDHVPPSLVDYDGLGIRVPLLIISAYAKQGYVSPVHYEHGSILKFIEDQWGLPRLSASDTRANAISPLCFDFSKPPRPFTKIPVAHDQAYFLAQPLDTRPPDSE